MSWFHGNNKGVSNTDGLHDHSGNNHSDHDVHRKHSIERVVKYQNVPPMENYNNNPPRNYMYKDHDIKAHENSPQNGNFVYRDNNSPPSRDRYFSTTHNYGKYNNSNDNIVCNDDGVCYKPNKLEGAVMPNHQLQEEADYYNKEKIKGSGFVPLSYDDHVPVSNIVHPRKETFYDISHKGNAQFDVSPIKDHNYYKETIDSAEARRRYGKGLPGAGYSAGEMFTGTIDSKEAARKYNGVFLND